MVEDQKYLEYVTTADGEVIPRGPIGERSVYTTPSGRIINMDAEGLPVQLGPKPEVIRVEPGVGSLPHELKHSANIES